MFGLNITIVDDFQRLIRAKDKAVYKNLSHAAASLRLDAMGSIEESEEPSQPGQPPHTRGESGHNLPEAIAFDVSKDDAVIGPRASVIGHIGAVEEFGEEFRGFDYEERPFMEPSLERIAPRFGDSFEGSIS